MFTHNQLIRPYPVHKMHMLHINWMVCFTMFLGWPGGTLICGFPAVLLLPPTSSLTQFAHDQRSAPNQACARRLWLFTPWLHLNENFSFQSEPLTLGWLGLSRATTSFAWSGTILRAMWAPLFKNWGRRETSLTSHLPVKETNLKHTRWDENMVPHIDSKQY